MIHSYFDFPYMVISFNLFFNSFICHFRTSLLAILTVDLFPLDLHHILSFCTSLHVPWQTSAVRLHPLPFGTSAHFIHHMLCIYCSFPFFRSRCCENLKCQLRWISGASRLCGSSLFSLQLEALHALGSHLFLSYNNDK